jgi:hypothetical protein
LADDGEQRTDAQFPVVGNRDGNRAVPGSLLHYDMAAAPSRLDETMGREYPADFTA